MSGASIIDSIKTGLRHSLCSTQTKKLIGRVILNINMQKLKWYHLLNYLVFF